MVRTLILGLLAAIFFTSPGANPPTVQGYAVLLLVIVGIYYVVSDWSTYKRNNAWRWELILPLLFFVLYPIAALLFGAVPMSIPLLVAALVLGAGCAIYTFSPYVKWP
jgi:uncharacterized membrane protein HdeD (DUF308 family)